MTRTPSTGRTQARRTKMAEPVEMAEQVENSEESAIKNVENSATVERLPSQRAAPVPQPPSAPGPAAQAPKPLPAAGTPGVTAPVEYPHRIRELVVRVENGWRGFRAAAGAIPSERMDERLTEDGWTRKQMLAHIAAWHDVTHDRLGKMILTGRPDEHVEDTDAFNARIARQAVGRTAGEVVKEMEMTFNRLRRRLGQMTDQQLSADQGWAAQIIAGNTYEHYDEHWADVVPGTGSNVGQPARR